MAARRTVSYRQRELIMRATLAIAAALVALGAGAAELGAQARAARPDGCERAPGRDRAVVWGVVRDTASGLPAQQAALTASWSEGGRRRTVEVDADHEGEFRFCDVPAGITITVEARHGTRAAQSFGLDPAESRRLELGLDASRSTVTGKVVEHGQGRAIQDAEVRVRGTGIRAISGADGTFRLPDLPGGVYWLQVQHIAYAPREDSVRVAFGAKVQYTIALSEQVIALPAIEVEVRSVRLERAGYYDRAQRGSGTYITSERWEAQGPQYASDIMRTVAGVQVAPRTGGGPGYEVQDRMFCPFRYYVDGARVSGTFQMDDIPVTWIEAFEIYRGASSVPAEFTMSAAQERGNCGVIVIWTRGAR
jgi:hypothetical protein